MNEENLASCYQELRKDAASGIDGVTVEEYGQDLEQNLQQLVKRKKQKRYQPQPARRVYIPKAGRQAERRGLSIPTVEDKLVQRLLKHLLEAIYENDFMPFSFGFRPKRSSVDAIRSMGKEISIGWVSTVVEVDIRKFFDNVNHDWLIRCLKERISDLNFIDLITKTLKAGIIEQGVWQSSQQGTAQGSSASPVLANIYLHYVLDLWFGKVFRRLAKGKVELTRFCDDFVVCCKFKEDADLFLELLPQRLLKFGLEIAQDKTRQIAFGRYVKRRNDQQGKRTETFNFLGFTHVCTENRKGQFQVQHKTAKKSFSYKLKSINEWLKRVRNWFSLKTWWSLLASKLQGHYAYFGVSGNYRSIHQFYRQVLHLAKKWVNRRSQKRSMTWKEFYRYLKCHPLPRPKIYHNLYQTL